MTQNTPVQRFMQSGILLDFSIQHCQYFSAHEILGRMLDNLHTLESSADEIYREDVI